MPHKFTTMTSELPTPHVAMIEPEGAAVYIPPGWFYTNYTLAGG